MSSRLIVDAKRALTSLQRRYVGNRRKITRRRAFRLTCIEQLESRELMAIDFPAEIIAGRSLSAYSSSDVQGGQLKLSYAVYNQRELPMEDVQVSVTLATGVGFVQASLPTISSGQNLAWDLGSLPAYGRMSFEVTVSLADASVLSIDQGVRVQGRIDAGLAIDMAPAAMLRPGPIPRPELASTMDATALDPWIMEKAAELDYDPAKIFSFLNDQVGFEAYQGSLRGSRGTLWSAAGNSLDETSLGVALFRASGIPARYATGTLSTIDAERLIESMFPTQTNLAGYLAAGQQGADPASNPELIALARQHYWLQIDLGAGFLNADTSGLPGSAIGVSHTALAGSFNEVADTLRHKLTMMLDAEVYSEIQAAFNPGNALTTTRVLDRTWNAVELVGKPVTIGHFVVDTNQGGLAFSSRTIGYTPYFLVGDAADISNANDPIFTGIPFQENLTNFPLGSQFLTGLALQMDISGPGGSTERFHRQLVDRVGFANRKNGTTENIPVDANAPSIIGPFDAFTVNASAASIPSRVADQLANKIRTTQRRLNAVDTSVPVSAADQSLLTQQYRDFTRLMGYRYLHESDALFNRSAALGAVRSYYDQPRLILGEAVLVPGTATSEATVELAIDLRRDAPKVILFPGQSEQAEPAFRFLQGVAATNLERSIVASMIDGTVQSQIVNTQSVIEAAEAQNIPLVVLIPSNLQTLENRIHASEDALARISEALAHGKVVLVPESPVQIDQRNVTAWYETDAVTGDTISVSEDGRHVAAIEYKTILYNLAGFQLGAFYGFLEGILEGALDKLGLANSLNTVSGPSKVPTKIISALLKLAGISGLSASQLAYKGGYYLGFYLAQKDPEAEGQLYQPLPAETTNTSRTLLINSVANNSPLELLPSTNSIVVNQNSTVSIPYTISSNTLGEYEISATGPVGWSVSVDQGAVSITPEPGTQNGLGQVRLVARSVENPAMVAGSVIDVTVQPTIPGLQFDVIPDPLFFVPFQGAELPSAFLAQIRNLGPLNELYTLQVSNQPSDWDVILSSGTANVSAGSQSSIGVYLRPKNTVLPPAGSVVSFDMTAIATSDPSLRQTVTVRYVLPSISATTISLNSNFIESFPGSITNGMITVKNVGHRQENLRLESNSLPPGFTLAGLPQTISLAVGQSIDVPITMQISSNAAINDTAYAYLSLKDDIPNAPIRNSDVLSVRVVVPGAEAISSASINAYQLGQTDLGNRLSDLSISLSSLVQSPTDAVTKSQSVAAIDAVLQIISADPLLSSLYSADLAFARNQLASASTLFEVQSALDSLAFYLTLLSDTLGQLVEHQFTLQLVSNVVTALPGVPAQFQVVLQNMGSKTTTFDLSVGGGLPFGTNATFNRSSVTLQPGETLQAGPNGITLSLSFTEDFLFPASFTVNATALEAPSLVQRAAASVLVRDEFIQATSVTPSPSFTEPGGIVAVSAKLLSIVNSDQVVSVSYQVKSPTGAVVFSSPSQPVNLNIRSTITDVNLPSLDTTGLPRSDYTIVVSIADSSGTEIPGAAGQASLQVGTPVSASIAVLPIELFSGSGSSIVTNTLRVDARVVPSNPLTLLGQVQTIPTSTTLVIQGGLAYVAGTNGIQVVNIANPTSPVIVGSFGQGEIVQGGFTVARALAGNKLLIATQASINATDFTLLTYSLANPVAPSLLGRSTVPKQFISDFFVVGDRAIATTTGIEFFAGNVLDQFGDVLALDLADPSAVLLTDELFGGSFDIYNHNGGEVVNNTTMYVASTTSTGFNTQVGHGVVRVIDFSDRANLVETRDIRIPDTVQATEVAIDGNRALVLGSTGGWKSPFLGAGDAQLTGRMTLTLLDITDPIRPLVNGTTLITESFNRPVDTADGGARLSTIALGNGRFAISRGFVDNQPVLLLADITGDQIVVASVPVPSLVNEMAFANGKLYTTSQTGLMIYDVGGIDGTPTTIRVEVPISNEFDRLNRVIMDSFNIRPDQIIDSGSAMSLVWNRPFAFGTTNSTLTWNTELSGLKPNEPQRVTNGTNIEFSFAGTPGSFALPATTVVGKNAIRVSPATQTAPPGATATYDVTLSNPTDSFLTFNLSISGIPESWIDFERFVIVDPQSSRTESISITAPTLTPVGAVDFKILATANGSL
ncbi:MAG: transglutaminase domain-containing protein, partial [Pirellula sp.]